MTTNTRPVLAQLYAQVARQAARTGQDKQLELKGGARLCVRIVDAVTTLSIARKGKPVGATELETFRIACQIPSEATRWPAQGQHHRIEHGVSFYQVVYRWRTIAEDDGV